jgi:pimeloyl-ACP methyl ester carboxylesterase
MTNIAPQTGYAPVNGLQMYYEIHGTGKPLVLVHGGFGVIGMFAQLLPALAATRQVIAVELQAHGHTADIDRPRMTLPPWSSILDSKMPTSSAIPWVVVLLCKLPSGTWMW